MAKKVIEWPVVRPFKHWTGKKRWVVDATLNGKRDRRYFKTKAEAEVCQLQKYTERHNHGTSVLSLSDDLRREAIDLNEKVRMVGHTLTTAVEFFFKHARPSSEQKTIQQVIDELSTKREQAGRSKEYLRIQGSVLRKFARTFGERPIHTVMSHDIEEWLNSNQHWAPETRRNYLKDLRSLWSFALRYNYVPENPVKRLEVPTVPNVAPGILTPKQARSLLVQAAKVKGKASMLPFVAIGMFAGLRSAEVCRLDWKEVDLAGGLIEVTSEKAKSRQRRHVAISANLAAWLKTYAQADGPVVAVDRPEGKLTRLAAKAGITPWPKNALRHSFASYHLAHHKDAAVIRWYLVLLH